MAETERSLISRSLHFLSMSALKIFRLNSKNSFMFFRLMSIRYTCVATTLAVYCQIIPFYTIIDEHIIVTGKIVCVAAGGGAYSYSN